jgi:hypothetical protein
MASLDPIGAGGDGLEYCDDRVVFVIAPATRNPHMATATGDKWLPLSKPTLAVFVDGELYPMKWRSRTHKRKRGVKLLADPERNDPHAYAATLTGTAAFKSSQRYLRKQAGAHGAGRS